MSGVLVQIRDVEPAVRDRLKERAARQGVSLNSYLKRLLVQEAAAPLRAEMVERLRARGDLLEEGQDPSADLVRSMRQSRDEVGGRQ